MTAQVDRLRVWLPISSAGLFIVALLLVRVVSGGGLGLGHIARQVAAHHQWGASLYRQSTSQLRTAGPFQMTGWLRNVRWIGGSEPVRDVARINLEYVSPTRYLVQVASASSGKSGVGEQVQVGMERCSRERRRSTLWSCRESAPLDIVKYIRALLLGRGLERARFSYRKSVLVMASQRYPVYAVGALVDGEASPSCGPVHTEGCRWITSSSILYQGTLSVARDSLLPFAYQGVTLFSELAGRGTFRYSPQDITFRYGQHFNIRLPTSHSAPERVASTVSPHGHE